MVKACLLSQYIMKSEWSTIGSSEQAATDIIQLGGALPVIHVIQRRPFDQRWESKRSWRAMIQEANDVKKINTK